MSDPFVSYSQNGEDVVLWRALGHVSDGFYVDIGAGWPQQHSVTKAFSLRGWRGINVDPNPSFHTALAADRPRDISLCLGISDHHETLPFSVIAETGLSTFEPTIADRHRASGWQTQEIRTETITLAELWEKYIPHDQPVHFLKVDAEGFEEKIIGSNDWSKNRPWVVVCESTAPLSSQQTHHGFEKVLLDAEYVFVLFDGLNRYYVSGEHSEIIEKLSAPANPLDAYISIDLKVSREMLDERERDLEDKLQELAAARSSISDMQVREEEREGRLLQTTAELTAANSAIVEIQGRLDEREHHVSRLMTELQTINRSIGEMQGRLAERENYVSRLMADLHIANRSIGEMQMQLGEKEHDVRQAGEELRCIYSRLEDIYQSTSWRLTRPVRGVKLALNAGRSSLVSLVKNTPLHRPLKSAYIKYHNKKNKIELGGGFAYYDFGDFVLAFDKNPCIDKRGIGRVANSLASELDLLAPRVPEPIANRRVVYLFPSVHWVPSDVPRPNLVMIHDVIPLIYPEAFPAGVVDEWHGKFTSLAHAADKIITISNSSADSISDKLEIERSKIVVNYNGVVVGKSALEDNVALPREKFFCILGSADYHKNFQIAFQAFEDERLADLHLVVIGDGEAYQNLVTHHPAKARIHLLSRVQDGTVFEVLKRAEGLLFPSLYEGFGLPPFEAALLGTPSICSRRPAMDELFSDECLFVPHDDPTAWADAIIQLAHNPKLRDELAKKAASRAQEFTWKKTADRLVEICRQHGLSEKTEE